MLTLTMKLKTIYICEQCAYKSSKWLGKCPDCGTWSSFQEDVVSSREEKIEKKAIGVRPMPLSHVLNEEVQRMITGISEWDRVVGGGIVPGALMLIGGEPGIGKSTLMLQVCKKIVNGGSSVLYVSGEESSSQISLRADRLRAFSEKIKLVSTVQLESIIATINAENPSFVIVDSIQVVASDTLPGCAGTVSQIRYCTEALMHLAKLKNIPILIVGHVTKDGAIAGPKVLEHLVDVVLYVEGDRYQNLRLLRCVKNRFGSTNEVGVFQMESNGLQNVSNPAEFFLEGRADDVCGSTVTMTVEGSRSFLVEVQALTNLTSFGYPKRTTAGFDLNRMQLLIAILGKHAGINLQNQDVFVNVVGGFKLSDPGCDVGVAMAVASSLYKKPLPRDVVFIGELGLTGEVRSVTQFDRRLKEAAGLGFKKVYTSRVNKGIRGGGLEIVGCQNIQEIVGMVFRRG